MDISEKCPATPNKPKYQTKGIAEIFAMKRAHFARQMVKPYLCPSCRFYHLTSLRTKKKRTKTS